MIYTLQAPSRINTSIQLPASKSISNRILILNALSKNSCRIINLSESNDTKVLQNALQSDKTDFDVGAAGTSMRFLTAYLSLQEGEWTITGTERMKKRPIGLLVNALRTLGAEIDYLENTGFPPLRIRGKKLKGGFVSLNGGISSQYISALIMIGPYMIQGLELHLEGSVISKPYIQMTACLMEKFGVQIQWKGQTIHIRPQNYFSVPFQIESDWSAASYWYEIMALIDDEKSSIQLNELQTCSVQGDAVASELFAGLCVNTSHCETDKITVLSKSSGFNRAKTIFHYNFADIPDLAQTLVVTCCLMNIPFRFEGLQSLKIKETDRISALRIEMRKLGYLINNESDSIITWKGERCDPVPYPLISTYEDHRMAMAFAPACLKIKKIKIEYPEVVVKSYPNYWNDLQSAGFIITEEK
jgi:3-phosphoshikimate 1-carboxyvinyltransferase